MLIPCRDTPILKRVFKSVDTVLIHLPFGTVHSHRTFIRLQYLDPRGGAFRQSSPT